MEPDSAPTPVHHVAPNLSRDAQLRLILKRVDSGYYQRADVLHEVAERIINSSE